MHREAGDLCNWLFEDLPCRWQDWHSRRYKDTLTNKGAVSSPKHFLKNNVKDTEVIKTNTHLLPVQNVRYLTVQNLQYAEEKGLHFKGCGGQDALIIFGS